MLVIGDGMVAELGPSSPDVSADALSTIKAISKIRIRIRAGKLPHDINPTGDNSGQSPDCLPCSLSSHQHHRIEGKNGQYGHGRTHSHQNWVKEYKCHFHENPNDSSRDCWSEFLLYFSIIMPFPVLQSHESLDLGKTLEIISVLQVRRLRPREGGDWSKVTVTWKQSRASSPGLLTWSQNARDLCGSSEEPGGNLEPWAHHTF